MTTLSIDDAWKAVLLVSFGSLFRPLSLEECERLVKNVLIPLYVCGVIGYISIRIFHVAIEPRLSLKATSPVPKAEISAVDDAEGTDADQPIDLTGAYRLQESHNFEGLLEAQGVPWALRIAANQAKPTHRITHNGNRLTIKIEGIIESQTTYQIGGPPVRSTVRGRLFEDQVTYLKDLTGIQTIKRAVNDGYTVQVWRKLADDRSIITMLSSVKFDDPSKSTVEAKQIFQRVEE